MARNYYAILGVLPTATEDEIKSAYRRRVKQYHPDRFGKDSAPFLTIQEAYGVLGDPGNRSHYDRSLQEGEAQPVPVRQRGAEILRPRRAPVEPLTAPHGTANFGTIYPPASFQTFSPSFDEIFDNLWNELQRYPETKSGRHATLSMEIRLTPDQVRRGGTVRVDLPLMRPCEICAGRGDIGTFYCRRCHGTGSLRDELSFLVEFPPGINDSHQIAIPLDQYGVHDLCPVLVFRVTREGDFEGM